MNDTKEFSRLFAGFGMLPSSIFLALIVQIAGALIWATHLDSRVENIEKQSLQSIELNEKFARLEERIVSLRAEMAGVNYQLRTMNSRLLQPEPRSP